MCRPLRAALAAAATAVYLPPAFGQGSTTIFPPCSLLNKGYDDPVVKWANGGLNIPDATACQNKCASDISCSVFTYYPSTGGCYLQGAGLTPKDISGAISGPRLCNGIAATLAPTLAPTPPVVGAVSPVPPPLVDRFIKVPKGWIYFQRGGDHTAHLVRGRCVCGEPDPCANYIEVPQAYVDSLVPGDDFNCKMLQTGALASVAAAEGTGNYWLGLPLWAWILIGVASLLLCLLLGLALYCWSESCKRRKRKSGARTRPHHKGVEDQAPLMMPAPLPQEFDLVTVTPQGIQVTPVSPQEASRVLSLTTGSGAYPTAPSFTPAGQGYSAPGYGAPSASPGTPPAGVGYGAPPAGVGYGTPPVGVGYGAPPPGMGYGAPGRAPF